MFSPEFDKSAIEVTLDALRKIREKQGGYTLKDLEKEYEISRESVYKEMDENFNNTGDIEEVLRQTATTLSEASMKVTPLTVTAYTCFFKAMNLMRDSASLFRTGKITGITSFDIGRGFGTVMLALIGANEDFHDQRLSLNLRRNSGLFPDQTGFSYMENAAKSWGRGQLRDLIKPHEVRESVIDGVSFGADVYKRMYPIAERVLSSGS